MVDISIIVSEIALSGGITVRGSKSTLYRYKRLINEYLEREKADWRVKADVKTMSIMQE